MNDLAALLADLYSRVPRGMELGLEKMRVACTRFDHPESEFKAIHVAGTNGKGSVCATVESVAREAGMKTGLYTSPHLSKFSERIRISGEPISDDTLSSTLGRVLDRAPELSFFEVATLTAFVAFAEAKVDLAVVEVGIGGRLDATNVLPSPLATGITTIAFDHMDRLGNSLTEIAREKAGIVKPGVPLVVGAGVPDEALREIERIARERGAPIRRAMRTNMANGTALRGEHQEDNADVSLWLVHESKILRGRPNPQRDILNGFANVKWPGRLERVETPEGAWLFDAAHNPEGARALAAYLAKTNEPITLVFGALADKAWREMLDVLAPAAMNRVYVAPKGRAPTPVAELHARHAGKMAENADDAMQAARALAGRDGLVVVAGSIFLVGEIRSKLLGLPVDPPVAL